MMMMMCLTLLTARLMLGEQTGVMTIIERLERLEERERVRDQTVNKLLTSHQAFTSDRAPHLTSGQ